MIVFHKEIRARLLQQARAGHHIPSLLLVGPRGVGKCTLAQWYAQMVLCEASALQRPCAVCAACRAMQAGVHPDMEILERDEETLHIEALRRLHVRLSRTPMRAPWSVTIIPDSERLSLAAQHACLKTLEEPRAKALILLTATSTEALLPTVLSRLAIVRVKPVSDKELRHALHEADAALSPPAREALLQMARGIPGMIMQNGTVRPEAYSQGEHLQRCAEAEGKPFWIAHQVVRKGIDNEKVHDALAPLLAAMIRRRTRQAPAGASLQLPAMLFSALTNAVNKDLAFDAFGIALAHKEYTQ